MVFQEVICKECGEEINVDLDKHTLIGTYKGDHVMDESYFHFDCFVKWYNRKVSEKAKNSVKTMQDKVQGLMDNPKIAGLLSMVGGVDKLKGMLNTNLGSDNKNINEEMDVSGMIADFMGDDPETMKEGTITPMPKSSIKKVNNDDGKKRKPRAKPKPTKKKVQ